MLPDPLVAHLASWIGAWPPPSSGVTIVACEARARPEWDGKIRSVRGVRTPEGTVIGVQPDAVTEARSAGTTIDDMIERLPDALGRRGWRMYEGVFRWTDAPAGYDSPGTWRSPGDARNPEWLHPFNADVLVGIENGDVAAGVGRKVHDDHGQELAVVTAQDHRGRGWAKRLVSQAAQRVIDEGAIPTYLHAPGNEASARTAEASGFPDRGWTILGLYPAAPG